MDLRGAPGLQRRRRNGKALVALTVCVLLCGGLLVGTGWYVDRKLTSQIGRIPDAFDGMSQRPVKPAVGTAKKATNILLIGTDRRSETQTTGDGAQAPTWLPGGQRSDSLMLVHVSGDRDNVTVVSIPRDTWVSVPGHGRAKVNAAFSLGGPALTVQTVEELTDVRIDHLAVVDWKGFERVIDTLGSVDVEIQDAVYDSARDKHWAAGRHRLDGAEALLFVRQRYGLPGGDLDRVRRHQTLIRALLAKVLSQNLWSNPIKRYRMMDSVTDNLSIDAGWTTARVRHLARQLSDVDLERFFFTTVPVSGTGYVGAQSVVWLDRPAAAGLWRAINHDRAPQWFTRNPQAGLTHPVR